MTISEKILQLADKQSIKNKKIYEHLEITRRGLDYKLKNETFSPTEIDKISSLLGVPSTYFFEGRKPLKSGKVVNFIEVYKVPVSARAGYLENRENIEAYTFLEKVVIIDEGYNVDDTRVFEVEGNSMLPQLDYGDEVVAVRIYDVNALKKKRIYVFVCDTAIVIKRFSGEGTDYLLLTSDNEGYQDIKAPKDQIKEIWQVKKLQREID